MIMSILQNYITSNYSSFVVTLTTIKDNFRVVTENTRSSKQDTKDIKVTVNRIDSNMKLFNAEMMRLSNYVKVIKS